ncbi:hypothetical protein [Carboxylicivirga linearis]|uniref:Band 7 domain-containing protein n=1 Tax=Carboxylicivirga linearis TaxID=1628157 RepID=A0ABS5K1Y1_9BACT|nr:hypothetical protein [Carboxylicivirga linearis]MBS2101164.1 hypothetical protein [Carboxylicivirga linearis]
MKNLFILLILLVFSGVQIEAQDAFAVKKWSGRYPTMNNDYPFTFLCWKGWLPPVPHFFVRLYPSHYYYYLNSVPVYDVKSYTEEVIYQGLKLVLKELDRSTLEKTLNKVEGIQLNQIGQEAIESFLRDSRLKEIPDLYANQGAFLNSQVSLETNVDLPAELTEIFISEIQRTQEDYSMINKMDCLQEDKIKADAEINKALGELNGTILYTIQKVKYWQYYSQMKETHLDFLAGR